MSGTSVRMRSMRAATASVWATAGVTRRNARAIAARRCMSRIVVASVAISRASDENGARADAKRFHHIAASSDAAVHEHLGILVNRGEHFRQNAQRRRDAVELSAAVIRDDDGGGAVIDGLARIVRGVHALHDE